MVSPYDIIYLKSTETKETNYMTSNKIHVTKLFITDKKPITWYGYMTYRDEKTITIKTRWADEYDLGIFKIHKNDEGIEVYFTDRMYNIFKISHNGETAGYYINMCSPVRVYDERLEFTDYAIDICVSPEGSYEILDMDEYETYKDGIEETEKENMLKELGEIKKSLDKEGISYINRILYFI